MANKKRYGKNKESIINFIIGGFLFFISILISIFYLEIFKELGVIIILIIGYGFIGRGIEKLNP